MSSDGLPSFEAPPVIEVVLSLQVKRTALLSPHVGLFWSEIRDRFPVLHEHPYLDPAYERFPAPQAPQRGFKLLEKLESPRIWMVSASEDRLVQVQPDRLIFNWKKAGERPYPRFGAIRQEFVDAAERFGAFLQREELGSLEPEQCEVTYINHLPVGDGSLKVAGTLGQAFSVWNDVKGFAGTPEQAQFSIAYVMTHDDRPCGRLHVTLNLGKLRSTGDAVLVLNLTARGKPLGEGMTGALRFLDKGHESIVRTFDEITTERMHALWRKQNG